MIEVVESSPSARGLDPLTYENLYREVITECRSAASSCIGDERDYYERLASFVAPWLSTTALYLASPKILAELLARCLEVEKDLRIWSRSLVRRTVLASKVTILLGAFLVLLRISNVPLRSTLDVVRDTGGSAWMQIARSSDLERLSAALAVVILVAVRMINNTARS